MTLIDFLNANQGAAMAVLTAVYVIATIVIVYYNKKSIDELRQTRESESRPYLFLYLAKIPREQHYYLVLRNYGKTGGRIINTTIAPGLPFLKGAGDASFLNNTVVAPNQSIHLLVYDEAKVIQETEFSVCLGYEDMTGKRFEESYVLNLEYVYSTGFSDHSKSNFTASENALHNIASSLDSITMKMQ